MHGHVCMVFCLFVFVFCFVVVFLIVDVFWGDGVKAYTLGCAMRCIAARHGADHCSVGSLTAAEALVAIAFGGH